MKREYEKLHRRHIRHNRDRHKDSDETDVKQMSAKLEVENCVINIIVMLMRCS